MPVEDEGFQSYDPTEHRPESSSPAMATTLSDANGTALPPFDARYAEDFVGLLYLGALTKEFRWLGHAFVIRTLTQDEVLTVPILIKPWIGTIGEAKAYSTAMTALAVVSVDGQPLPLPVGDGDGDFAWAYQRFNYAKANWFQFTIDKVYGEYLTLETKAFAVIEAMEKASGPVESTGGLSATFAGPNDEAF